MIKAAAAVILAFLLFVLLASSSVLGSVQIQFYRGIFLALATVAIQWVGLKIFAGTEAPQLSALRRTATCSFTLSLLISFWVVLPVTIDRSVTVFLLGSLADRTGPVSKKTLRDDLLQIYVDEFDAVERRMQEQVASGNVRRTEKGFELTPQGRRFVTLCEFLTKLLPIDPKYLHHKK